MTFPTTARPHWFTVLDDMAVWKMRDSLLTLDEESRVNPYDPEVKRIQIGAEKIIKEMIRSVCKEDGRFGGRLVEMGSYYNQTKIGKPDAFDYGLELRLTDIAQEPSPGENLEWLWKPNGFMGEIKVSFERLMNEVMVKTAMPSNWFHGGFNEPRYSGFRRNGPASVLQFSYKDPVTDRDAHITVQLFLLVKVPFSSISVQDRFPIFCSSNTNLKLNYKLYKFSLLDFFQQQRTEYIHLPIWFGEPPSYVEMVLHAISVVEQKWLNQFSAMAVPKRVIRICRALVVRFLTVSSKHTRSSLPRRVRKSLDAVYAKMEKCRKFTNGVIGFKHLGDPSKCENGTRTPLLSYAEVELDLVAVRRYNYQRPSGHSFMEVNELVQSSPLFSSHLFRHIVLTIMSLERQHGREWRMDDVPRLVVHVFDVIHDHLTDERWLHVGPACLEYNNACSRALVHVLLGNDLYAASTRRRQLMLLVEVLREMAHTNSGRVSPYKALRHGAGCTGVRRACTQSVRLIHCLCLVWGYLLWALVWTWRSRARVTAIVRNHNE